MYAYLWKKGENKISLPEAHHAASHLQRKLRLGCAFKQGIKLTASFANICGYQSSWGASVEHIHGIYSANTVYHYQCHYKKCAKIEQFHICVWQQRVLIIECGYFCHEISILVHIKCACVVIRYFLATGWTCDFCSCEEVVTDRLCMVQ